MPTTSLGILECALLSDDRLENNRNGLVRPAELKERRQFIETIAQIHEGATAEDVQMLLGQPDCKLQPNGELSQSVPACSEILCYGTTHKGGVATLGRILMKADGNVCRVIGRGGTPLNNWGYDEETMRHVLECLADMPPSDIARYDPRFAVRIVNELQKLGKDDALLALKEYLRISAPWEAGPEAIHLILLALFEIPKEGFFPRLHSGLMWPPEPKARRLFPRYPILMEQDVPLLIASPMVICGETAIKFDYLDSFWKRGKLRERPLCPPDSPLEILQRVQGSEQWLFDRDRDSGLSNRGKIMLIKQLVRLVKPGYRLGDRLDQFLNLPGKDIDRIWQNIKTEMSTDAITWDPVNNCYRNKRK